MFGKEKIPQIQADIAGWAGQLRDTWKRAGGLYRHGQAQAKQLDNFYMELFQDHAASVTASLAKKPADWIADWGNSVLWQAWAPNSTHEFATIRAGEMVSLRGHQQPLVPGFLPFIGANKTIIIRSDNVTQVAGAQLLQSLLMRTALMLPHQARYTLVDPAGAGRAFPMRRHLPQVRENSGDVRRDLDGVIVDIQRIIQTYLDASTTSFEQIDETMRFNEAYQFVFAADFPKNYDRRAIEALRQIGNTGCVAGVYLLIHYNSDFELPRDESLDTFENAYYLDLTQKYGVEGALRFQPDGAPAAEIQDQLFRQLAEAKPPERIIAWDDMATVSDRSEDWWRADATDMITTQIGVHGSSSSLNIWFGVQDGRPCAHGMLGAMTGSGKSNLYHVLIAGMTTQYSPEELRLYLIDGKDGVEFQPYRNLPPAEVVSLRSSPELSRSVLTELIAEKERRNDLFTSTRARDFGEYREKGQPGGPLPRILLLVDEYQELFEGDRDGVASDMLLQLAAQGRSAGIHMLLGSQHFGAAGMVNRQKIFGNFHLRAAMQMASDDIQALSEFGRRGKALIATTCNLPGKIVINDSSGDDSGNVAGKCAFLASDKREALLRELEQLAEQFSGDLPARVIFDGKKQPTMLDNPQFAYLLHHRTWPTAQELEVLARKPLWDDGFDVPGWFAGEHPHAAWMGQDFSVRGQAMIVLRRRIAENVMIVGNATAERYGMLAGIVASLALNAHPVRSQFYLADCSVPGTPWGSTLQSVHDLLLAPAGFDTQFTKEPEVVEQFVLALESELKRRRGLTRAAQAAEPETYVVMAELDRVDALRQQVGSYGMTTSPMGEQLARVYAEGPPLGIHCIFSFSGVQPMAAVVDMRSGLLHFRHRVASQMSEDASHGFVRSRLAAQLQKEGPMPVCALYFDVESDQAIRFKPYTISNQLDELPIDGQLQQIGDKMSRRRAVQ